MTNRRTPNEIAASIVGALVLLGAMPFVVVLLILFRLYEAWADSRACKAFLGWWFGRRA